MTQEDHLSQWQIWPPALAGLLLLQMPGWLLQHFAAANWLLVAYLLLDMAALWWLAPRFGLRLWREGDTLCWRWGIVRHGVIQRLALVDIRAVEVGTLPDQPFRPYRQLGDTDLHGGNFTPSLNRGVKLSCRDGRTRWFGLPQPEKFASALRAALPGPI